MCFLLHLSKVEDSMVTTEPSTHMRTHLHTAVYVYHYVGSKIVRHGHSSLHHLMHLQVDNLSGPSLVELVEQLTEGVKKGRVGSGSSAG